MGNTKSSYVLVGAFVLLMLGGLLLALVKLSGWTADNVEYYTAFRNVTGVKDGTKVYYQGFAIGRVTNFGRISTDKVAEVNKIQMERRRQYQEGVVGGNSSEVPVARDVPIVLDPLFEVHFEVSKTWKIPENAVAEIAAPGFLAAMVINIRQDVYDPGTRAPDVPAGGFVSSIEPAGLQRKLASAADKIGSFAQAAQATLAKIDPAIGDVSALARTLTNEIPPVVQGANEFVNKLNVIADEVRGYTTEENREQVARLLRQLNAAADDVNRFTDKLNHLADAANDLISSNRQNIDQSIASFRYIADSIARDIDAINRNIEGTSRNMYEFSRQIRQNPGVLLSGTAHRDGSDGRR